MLEEAQPSPEQLEALHAAFVPAMVRINAEGGYARRRALLLDMPPRAVPLLRRFVDARLLVTDRDTEGREIIEVAHEALLRAWPQLTTWLAEDQDKLRLLESLQQAAEEWNKGGQRPDLLIHRDGRLQDAEALLANSRFAMAEGSVERAYLDACGAAQRAREAAEKEEQERRIRDAEQIADEQRKRPETQRRSARRTRWLLLAVTLVAVLAGEQYWEAMQAARRADAGRLAIAAGNASQDLQMLLALEAVKASPIPEANEVLERALSTPLKKLLRGHARYVDKVVFSRDGKRLATADFASVLLWDMQSEQQLATLSTQASHITLSPDGRLVAILAQDGAVDLELPGHLRPTGGGLVSVWETDDDPPRVRFSAHNADFHPPFLFSIDGKRIISASAGHTLRFWNPASGTPIGDALKGHDDRVTYLTFSADGATLLSIGLDHTLRRWDGTTGEPLGSTPLKARGEPMEPVSISPDGRYLASTGIDTRTLQVWDVGTGGPLGEPLTGHGTAITAIAFSADSRQLVTGDAEGEIRLWSLHRPGDVGGIYGEQGGRVYDLMTGSAGGAIVRDIAYAPNGKFFVTASDFVVRLWWPRAHMVQPIEAACSIVNRNLSRDELRRYLSGRFDDKTCPALPGSDDQDGTLAPHKLANYPTPRRRQRGPFARSRRIPERGHLEMN